MAIKAAINIILNEKLYIRDPEKTELGRKILSAAIELIEEIGFESFTFKKLATKIDSTEASIYRYFENKHKLLTYLVSWYWSWLEYQINYQTHNIEDPQQRLKIALKVLADDITYDPQFSHINEVLLHKIVVNESDKTYLTKEVDDANKEGFYRSYKSLCSIIAKIVKEVNPNFKYPYAIISTAIEASHQQKFFAQHLPSLTELDKGNSTEVSDFLNYFIFRVIHQE